MECTVVIHNGHLPLLLQELLVQIVKPGSADVRSDPGFLVPMTVHRELIRLDLLLAKDVGLLTLVHDQGLHIVGASWLCSKW